MRMTFRTIVLGGVIVFFAVVTVVVFVPGLIWDPPQTTIAHAYTPEQQRGRELFYSNGCNYCHTQYVRAEDTAMGPVSEGGNYVFDDPMILGSERTGPDLSYLGRKRSEQWEIEHLKEPRQFSPLSIMPSFAFLSQAEMEDIAAYLFALGDRVAQARMILPPDDYAGVTDPIHSPPMTPVAADQSQGWATWQGAGLQDGKELYVQYCLTCHGCAGNGLGSYGGTMSVTPANYKQDPFRDMPDEQWFWHLAEGVPGTLMPTWKASLSEEDIWKVIRYVQEIFARPTMRDPNEGDPSGAYANLNNPEPLTVEVLEAGKQIFIRECMVCHGDSGRGEGPYGDGLEPSPPDFSDGSYGTLQNPSYTDSDYFWRISEGLPWSAMPAWKLQYSEADRWNLVHYIRTNFTQTEARPQIVGTQVYPAIYLTTCAHCHGLAGDGAGWDGQYLDVKPAALATDQDVRALSEGELFGRVTFGVQDSAMPSWGEFLPEEQRWDAIRYVIDAFLVGRPQVASVDDGSIAPQFLTVSQDNWVGEGNVISVTNGANVYATYCATCHGDKGQGNGVGTTGTPSGSPAPLPANMETSYIMWRIWEGVPDGVMGPFNWILSEEDIWDTIMYVESLFPTGGGQ